MFILFMDHWIRLYRVPDYVLPENETQFINTFVELLCAFLRMKH